MAEGREHRPGELEPYPSCPENDCGREGCGYCSANKSTPPETVPMLPGRIVPGSMGHPGSRPGITGSPDQYIDTARSISESTSPSTDPTRAACTCGGDPPAREHLSYCNLAQDAILYAVLQRIADMPTEPRPDGTYNYSREAIIQMARKALDA